MSREATRMLIMPRPDESVWRRSCRSSAGSPKNRSAPCSSSARSPRWIAPTLAAAMLPYEVRNCPALSPTNCAIDRRSFRSSRRRPLSSAILKTRDSTPAWISFRLRILPKRSGPISETVARTGCPSSPKRSQKVTGYPRYSNPSNLSCATRSTTFGLSPPGREIPDRSPFTSARKTGTPIALNRSASTRSVTAVPVCHPGEQRDPFLALGDRERCRFQRHRSTSWRVVERTWDPAILQHIGARSRPLRVIVSDIPSGPSQGDEDAEEGGLRPLQRRCRRRRGGVRRAGGTVRNRGDQFHVRRTGDLPLPRRPRPLPGGTGQRRREPLLRVAPPAPHLHGRSDDPEGPADDLVPGQLRPRDLRDRCGPPRRDGQGRHRVGGRVRQAVQQANLRLRSGEGRLAHLEGRPVGRTGRRAGDPHRQPLLRRDGNPLPRRKRPKSDPGALRALLRVTLPSP